jgi:hypothetical protein
MAYDESSLDGSVESSATDGKIVEVWIDKYENEEDIPAGMMIREFAAYLENPHAHGQWLICEIQWHEKSNNPKWKGFQKVYRKKYRPTKFRYKHEMIMNSSNYTDSYPENWGHCQSTLNLLCAQDVYVFHRKSKRRGR